MSASVPPTRGRGSQARSSVVYRALLDHIHSGALLPGTRIREDEIAVQLGVSRTPVREALARLQARGLIDSSRGGMSVVELTRQQVMELYATRTVLEGASARFAAENAFAEDLLALEHVAAQFDSCSGDATAQAKANIRFHDMIAEAAHNRYLVRMIAELNDFLTLLKSTTFSVSGRPDAAREEHRAILKAIRAHDPNSAETAARLHITQARKARLALMFS